MHFYFPAEQLQAFHSVASQMLQDVQERLVYRANIYIRDDIRAYKPSPGDLAYPEKLQMMEVPTTMYKNIWRRPYLFSV